MVPATVNTCSLESRLMLPLAMTRAARSCTVSSVVSCGASVTHGVASLDSDSAVDDDEDASVDWADDADIGAE